jgi:rhodanese-related sulfurtransferase
MKTIDADQLSQLLRDNEDILVIDVLPEESYQKSHVPGAVNIPYKGAGFANMVQSTARDKRQPIVVYCSDTECDLSDRAGARMEELGFSNVMHFAGGLKAWEESGQQTVAA